MAAENFLDVISDPTTSVGSVSMLAFLTDAQTPPVRSDPLRLWYGMEAEKPSEQLDEIYEIEPAEDGQLEISRRNSSAHIAQSLPLDFLTLAGAATVYAPQSRLPRLVTIYREAAEKPRGISRVGAPSPLSACVSKFWNRLNPDASLIREFTVQIPSERARTLFAFERLEEAIETNELQSQSQSAESLAQRLPELKDVGAIADESSLRDFLDQWTEILDIDLWNLRDRVRFRWGSKTNENVAIQLSALAEPFFTTFLHNLLSLEVIRGDNGSEVSWYLPGDHDITDLAVDYRGEQYADANLPESLDCPFLKPVEDEEGGIEAVEYTEKVPLTPSVLPFVTQGLALSDASSADCTLDYESVSFMHQIFAGLRSWSLLDAVAEIAVDYETRAKVAIEEDRQVQSQSRGKRDITDEYVTAQIPFEIEELQDRFTVRKMRPKELLGLVERHFGSAEKLIDRPQPEQATLDEIGNASQYSTEYKHAFRKETQVQLVIDDTVKTVAQRLWHDLFHPESEHRIKISSED